MANAHARDTRFGRVITKRTKDSPHKIDLAVAGVIAHERATLHAANPVSARPDGRVPVRVTRRRRLPATPKPLAAVWYART